jgi:hypothetical protein
MKSLKYIFVFLVTITILLDFGDSAQFGVHTRDKGVLNYGAVKKQIIAAIESATGKPHKPPNTWMWRKIMEQAKKYNGTKVIIG